MKQLCFSLFILVFAGQLKAQIASESLAKEVAAAYFQKITGRADVPMVNKSASTNNGNGHPAYYLFEAADGKGYVMVSGTKAARPVLAFSAENSFPVKNLNPELAYWLDGYKSQLETLIQSGAKANSELDKQWQEAQTNKNSMAESPQYGPYLTTRWSQGNPYNNLCPPYFSSPKAVTGCVATSMAQVMKYWNFPSVGKGGFVTYSDASGDVTGNFFAQIGGTVYDWRNMENTYTSGAPITPSTTAVSQLMYHCGVGARMDYNFGGSGAFEGPARDAMSNNFGYTSSTLKYRQGISTQSWLEIVTNELALGRPMIYMGGGGQGRHAWVCDGLKDGLFHMNWGWGGQADDYFTLEDLTPGSYSFNDGQLIMYQIVPPNCPWAYDGGGNLGNTQRVRYIHSNGAVPANTTVNANAGYELTFTPGFTAFQGSTFRAFIQACNGFDGDPDPGGERSEFEDNTVNATALTDLSAAPNPFSGSTTITYHLKEAQNVDIRIFNATGLLVSTPVEAQRQEAGEYAFTFGEADLPTGVYFLVAQLGDLRVTKRLVRTQ